MRFSLLIAAMLLSMALLPNCMRVSDGIEVDVAYKPAAMPAAVRTDLGYRVRLERAMIAIGRVELIRCDNFVLDLWNFVTAARAKAHEFSSPTSLGVPLVIDLMESAGVPLFAGTLRPPPGRYCGIRVIGMPADQDAEGLTDENLDMTRNSVVVAGRVEDEAGEDQTALLAQIWEILACEMRFDRPLVFDGPVVESVSIRIDHTKWFDGIDFALQNSTAVQQRIIENVRSSLQAVLPNVEDGL
ncbi:MAG: hypothetical protein OEN21_05425 [Myxococcales bacterium]|nr:hypothetical protein [Myxococcales bacterium]